MINVHIFLGPRETAANAVRNGKIPLKRLKANIEVYAPIRWWRELGDKFLDMDDVAKDLANRVSLSSFGLQKRDFSFEADSSFRDHNDGIGETDELPQFGFPEPGLGWDDEEAYRDAYFYRDGPYEALLSSLDHFGLMYTLTKDERWLGAIKDLLPESYNYTKAVSLTYKQLKKAIKRSREISRCPEWDEFETWIREKAVGADLLLGEEE